MFRLSYVLLKVVIADSSEIEIKEPNEIIKINLKYITINSISEKYIKGIANTRNNIFILLWTSREFFILLFTFMNFLRLLWTNVYSKALLWTSKHFYGLGGCSSTKIFF